MVDLGFLLITFFVFTTSLTQPVTMSLVLPNQTDHDSMTTTEGKTLNVLLAYDNKIYYYNGDSIRNIHASDFSPQGLRAVLIAKKITVKNKFGDARELVVLIKPTEQCTYQNIVDALDEMQINDIGKYMLLDASKNETALIQ
jgi:biopolymer transport protein ExbD